MDTVNRHPLSNHSAHRHPAVTVGVSAATAKGQQQPQNNDSEQNFQAIDIHLPDEPKLSAYVYTFGQTQGLYGIDLRYPITTNNIVGESENLSLEQTIGIITTHLF